MKIDFSQFSHLQSALPQTNKRKIKIYIAYKAKVSRYLAYIIYKTLSSHELFEIFYDRASIKIFSTWEEDLDVNMNLCDIVLIIGEKAAFNSLIFEKYEEDFFIKELISGIKKEKCVCYIPINEYRFWEEEYDEILSKNEIVKEYGAKLAKRNLESLSLKGSIDTFEFVMSKIIEALIACSENYLLKQTSEELKIQSTSELQKAVNSIQTK